jgi:hypothetical protein
MVALDQIAAAGAAAASPPSQRRAAMDLQRMRTPPPTQTGLDAALDAYKRLGGDGTSIDIQIEMMLPESGSMAELEQMWPRCSLEERVALLHSLELGDVEPRERFFRAAELALGAELNRVDLDRPVASLIAQIDDPVRRAGLLTKVCNDGRVCAALICRRGVGVSDVEAVFKVLVAGYRYELLCQRGSPGPFADSFGQIEVQLEEEACQHVCRLLIGATVTLAEDQPNLVRMIVDLGKGGWTPLFRQMLKSIAEFRVGEVLEQNRLTDRQVGLIFDGLFQSTDAEFYQPFAAAYWEKLVQCEHFEQLLADPSQELDFSGTLIQRIHEEGVRRMGTIPAVAGWFGFTMVVLALHKEQLGDYLKGDVDPELRLVVGEELARDLVGEHDDIATLQALQRRFENPRCAAIARAKIMERTPRNALLVRAQSARGLTTGALGRRGTMANFAAAARRGADETL